jgi:hypothetical protein
MCISLILGGKPSHVAHNMIELSVGPLNLKNIFFQNEYVENMKPITQIQNHQNPTP